MYKDNFTKFASIGKLISLIILALASGALLIYIFLAVFEAAPWRNMGAIWLVAVLLYGLFALLKSAAYYRNIERQPVEQEQERFQEQSKANQPAYLHRIISQSVQNFNQSTRWQYRNVRIFRYSIAVLTALSTIVLGINLTEYTSDDKFVISLAKNIALVLNTLATTLAALAVVTNIEKYWIQNKVIKYQLESLLQELEFEMGKDKIDHPAIQRIFSRYQEVLHSFYLYWEGALTDHDSKKTDSGITAGVSAPISKT